MSTTRSWVHLHLPRFRRGDVAHWSVKTGQAPVTYRANVTLSDVTFHVRESGRLATLATGRKNVHAWVIGTLIPDGSLTLPDRPMRQARYNPWAGGTFTDRETGQAVVCAQWAVMVAGSLFYVPWPGHGFRGVSDAA